MATGNELILRRVVVALDAAADFAPAIELAAAVAAGWRAGLRGLFAEDERLQRLAELPFAQQLDPATALRTPVSAAGLRAEIAAVAERMRQELKSVADRHGLPWSFEMMPESIGRDPLVLESDELLVVGVSTRPVMSQMRLDSPWQATAGRLRRRLLLVGHRATPATTIAVLYDASAAGRRALEAAIRIAGASGCSLSIVAPEPVPAAQRLEAEAEARNAGVAARVVVLRALSPSALKSALPSQADLLIVGGDGIAAAEVIESLLQPPSGAVLIV